MCHCEHFVCQSEHSRCNNVFNMCLSKSQKIYTITTKFSMYEPLKKRLVDILSECVCIVPLFSFLLLMMLLVNISSDILLNTIWVIFTMEPLSYYNCSFLTFPDISSNILPSVIFTRVAVFDLELLSSYSSQHFLCNTFCLWGFAVL